MKHLKAMSLQKATTEDNGDLLDRIFGLVLDLVDRKSKGPDGGEEDR
jgi:hypothetical protein